ncbi:hypothetical protein E4U35_000196 [Claviceps purpurea]|nr:hypothetical protein E4U27_006247 [Claviceps purpurea]KAG6199080.1 hypothetical protein E4U10_005495 [Claviceps purpurea]KAG6208279.1 hypothetical protein E4U35_000196 [Claviceps purpurea]KAG6275564.1 hypothetical protein E4U47_000729 [Claviceps purpurea]
MDQRELESRVKALTKSVAANEAPENAIKILESLKKDARPTEEMLRATKAGVFVGRLRANPNKEIARAASDLVVKWKKFVEAEKKQRSKLGSPSSGATSSPAPTPASANGVSNGTAAAGPKKTFTGNPETRRHETEGVDIQRTASKVRNSCIGLIYNGIAYLSSESSSDIISRAVAVEQAVFAHFKHDESADYKKKIRSLFANLKNKSNSALRARVFSGEISAQKFATMTDDELKSEEQRKMDAELEKENMKKAQVPQEQKSISDSLQCGRCKLKKVSYTQAQTRSADEPMTTFCECLLVIVRYDTTGEELKAMKRRERSESGR